MMQYARMNTYYWKYFFKVFCINFNTIYEERRTIVLLDNRAIKKRGGLHVIGTERHESRRIDNQLRGRSGRQGDSGSSRFFLSLEDKLLKEFSNAKISLFIQ